MKLYRYIFFIVFFILLFSQIFSIYAISCETYANNLKICMNDDCALNNMCTFTIFYKSNHLNFIPLNSDFIVLTDNYSRIGNWYSIDYYHSPAVIDLVPLKTSFKLERLVMNHQFIAPLEITVPDKLVPRNHSSNSNIKTQSKKPLIYTVMYYNRIYLVVVTIIFVFVMMYQIYINKMEKKYGNDVDKLIRVIEQQHKSKKLKNGSNILNPTFQNKYANYGNDTVDTVMNIPSSMRISKANNTQKNKELMGMSSSKKSNLRMDSHDDLIQDNIKSNDNTFEHQNVSLLNTEKELQAFLSNQKSQIKKSNDKLLLKTNKILSPNALNKLNKQRSAISFKPGIVESEIIRKAIVAAKLKGLPKDLVVEHLSKRYNPKKVNEIVRQFY